MLFSLKIKKERERESERLFKKLNFFLKKRKLNFPKMLPTVLKVTKIIQVRVQVRVKSYFKLNQFILHSFTLRKITKKSGDE